MKTTGVLKIISVSFFLVTFLSCTHPLLKKAYDDNERYVGMDGWRYKVDTDIHQYNVSHDTTLLYDLLAYLDSVQINDENKISWHNRRFTALRLLHKYDTVFAILDTCPDDAFGNFGKPMEQFLTELSQYNYNQQFEEWYCKIDEMVAYMEYCFELQEFVAQNDESGYMKKYDGNQLALHAVATEIDAYALNWYIGIRLLRGDEKTDMELLIENYHQKGYIDEIGKDWLRILLDGKYDEKDLDSQL